MPASATITSFYSFTSLTGIKSSEVNNNFSLIRGNLIPIDGSLSAFSNNNYDLGTSSFKWRYLYINGIAGTTTNDDAATGIVGQYNNNENSNLTLGTGATSAPSSGVIGGDHQLTCTNGDYDLCYTVVFRQNGATITNPPEVWIGTASGNSSSGRLYGSNYSSGENNSPSSGIWTLVCPSYRVSVNTTTIFYLKTRVSYSAGTPQYHYRFSWRRTR